MIFLKTLTEKTKELEKIRSEWTSQSSDLSSRHSQEIQSEREKALEASSSSSYTHNADSAVNLEAADASIMLSVLLSFSCRADSSSRASSCVRNSRAPTRGAASSCRAASQSWRRPAKS